MSKKGLMHNDICAGLTLPWQILCMLGKNVSRRHFEIFFLSFRKKRI